MTAGGALPALLALAVALAGTPAAIRLLRRSRLLDHPNERSNHAHPTVRGAGIAVAAAAFLGAVASADIAAAATGITLVTASVGFALIGVADDARSGVSVRVRLAGQVAVALAAVAALVIDASPGWPTVLIAGGALWVIAYVNAFNFMDGINGISAAQAVVAGAALAYIGLQLDLPLVAVGGAVIAAAALGFVPYNFPRARAFLGDVGSYFIGAWLALLAVIAFLQGANAIAVAAPFALYGADTATTLVRRVVRGEVWHDAHKEHTYQRLVALGWSHTQTTITITALLAASAVAGALTLHDPSVATSVFAAAAVATITAAYLALPASIAPALRRHPAGTTR